jgi:SAM-dependent methyltransferase
MHCPYCNQTSKTLLYKTYSFNKKPFVFSTCLDCQCIYLDPLPDRETLDLAYSDEYYGQGEAKFIKPVENFIEWFRRQRAMLIHSLLKGKGKVLDMGCGNGKFLEGVSKLGDYEIYGIEMPGNSAERAKKVKGLHLFEGEINKVNIETRFDAITLIHVFEHLVDPAITLDKIDNLLVQDGYLIITVPNISSIQSLLFRGYWFHLDVPRHLFFFEPLRFTELMKARGYELESSGTFSLEHSLWGFFQSLMNVMFKDRDLFYEILKGKPHLIRKKPFQFFAQVVLSVFVMPIAFVEFVVSGMMGRGVQKQFIFRKR